MGNYFHTFVGDLKQSFLDLTIIIGVIAFFQFVILREVPADWQSMVIGLVIVGVGLAFFMRGLEVGIFPLGEGLAKSLANNSSRVWIILFAFIIGFSTTIAEPALIAIAGKAAAISGGAIDATILRLVVALSVGGAIVLGVIRIILNHAIHWYIIAGYVLVLITTYFAPPEIIGLAYDSGGVTTSTVTVPLIAALGIGLASTLKNRNPVIDGFGLIAFASLTPMIFVQIYGIIAYSIGSVAAPDLSFVVPLLDFSNSSIAAAAIFTSTVFYEYAARFVSTIGDVLPIALTILFFYYVVLKTKIPDLPKRIFGFSLAMVGLYAFVIGLEIGLFPIGESITKALAEGGSVYLVYAFAFAIGFATTLAEPSLSEIARKAQQISGGAINALILRLFVASGVGVGILLGAYRIVNGDSIVWYIMIGYAVVVLLTFFAPRTIIPIAYDSGGVTTSTVTVPIVAALGLGLATTIPGRDPLIDGFGLIAFASLFPMISVLGYGIVREKTIEQYEKKLQSLSNTTVARILRKLHDDDDGDDHKRNKKEIITISGQTGSGASTIGHELSKRLNYHYFSAGAVFEAVAESHGVTITELAALAEEDPSIDREIDELVQELGIKHNNLVIDSRLAYHWIHRSFKVFLAVTPETALKRQNIKIPEDRKKFLETTADRHESKKRRYRELYGLDIENLAPFDLVLHTDAMTLDEAVDRIECEYQLWLHKKNNKRG